jgi:hemoglobin
MYKTYFDLCGGVTGMQNLATTFYRRVFDDPIMIPLFKDPNEDHVGRMALWLGEFFGGPAEHTRQRGGFPITVSAHHHLKITDTQRQHWIDHMLADCEEVNVPDEVMDFFTPHIYFGAQATQRGSQF